MTYREHAVSAAGSTRRWRRLRLFVLDRDGWRCQVPLDGAGNIAAVGRPCLLPADTCDHVVPRTRGGDDDPTNLRAACRAHNREKSGRLDGEALAPLSRSDPGRRPAGRTWQW